MKTFWVLLAVIACLWLCGCHDNRICGSKVSEVASVKDDLRGYYIDEYLDRNAVLPNGVSNVQSLGNGWLTFDLEVGGRKRTFLYARFKSASNYAVPVCTELSK